MLILQFLTETLQVRTGVNTLADTNQDKKSPGTHLGLTLWLSSALRVPICSFPASKRDDNPLRTMANWSGGLTLNVSDLKYNSLPFVWRNHPKPHLMPQQAFKHLQRRPALLWGGKGRKGGRPLNVAIEMWRRENACSDRSPSARHTANTTEISTLPSGPFTVDHAIEFSKPCVRMHYTALYNVAVADNGVEPRTSTTVIMQTFPMPTPHVASLLVASCSIAHRGNWVASVALDLLCDRAYSFAHQDRSSWAAVSCSLATCNWTSPKSDWAALVTLTRKGRKVSKTWWGWRKLEHFTALMRRSLTDKRHTASYLGSPFMSHQVPNGNRLSPPRLDLIYHSPLQYLFIGL